MKWFTLAWWMGDAPDGAAEAYQSYLDGIRPSLPVGIAPLLGEVGLHDARLRSLRLDVRDRCLTIGFDGFRYGPAGNEECRRSITLRYGGVEEFRCTADPEHGLRGPHGYGDLGYDEVELVPDGTVEHRLLFSSGIEMAVRFDQIEVAYRDVVASDAEDGPTKDRP